MRFAAVVAALTLASSAVATAVVSRDVVPAVQLAKRAIKLSILKNVTAVLTADAVTTNQVSGSFFAYSPVPISLQVTGVVANLGLNGVTEVTIDKKFNPSLKLSKTGKPVNSGNIQGINLPLGVAGSLDLLTSSTIDLQSANVSIIITAIDGTPIPIVLRDVQQAGVPLFLDNQIEG